MTRIIADEILKSKIKSFDEILEFCDESGRTLGFYHPVATPASLYENIEVPFTEEELRRREAMPGGRKLADILADLKNR